MQNLKFVPTLGFVATLLTSATPASALMFRPDLGMGLTDFLSTLAEECPATLPNHALDQRWRAGMPCPAIEPTDRPVLADPKIGDVKLSNPETDEQ